MKFLFLLIFLTLNSLPSLVQAYQCREILSVLELKSAQSFINYFDSVFKGSGETVTSALEQIIQNIDENKVVKNPITEYESAQSSVNSLRRETFDRLIEKLDFNIDSDLALVRDWASQQIIEKQRERGERNNVEKETIDTHYKGTFHPIKAGAFEYIQHSGSKAGTYSVELLQDFEMQSTHVSRREWFDVMGTHIPSERGMLASEMGGYPVENITVWSAMEYANALSILEGYEPVYDFSRLIITGSPEDGTYGESGVKGRLIINAPDGDIYQAEGYRLPTFAEYYMVVTDRGRLNKETLESILKNQDPLGLQDMPKTRSYHSVETGMLLPLRTNGADFYDLYSNAKSFSTERGYFLNDVPHMQGPNPVQLIGSNGNFYHVELLGSSFFNAMSDNPYPSILGFHHEAIDGRSRGKGIRLVRTLK